MAVDAAVVVDARKVGVGSIEPVGEVGAGLLGRDPAKLDRRTGGLLARAVAALDRAALTHTTAGSGGGAAVVIARAAGGKHQGEAGHRRN